MSPYLFIILMTCLFHDVHDNNKFALLQQKIEGTNADEVLYADDTICITQDEHSMDRFLAEIEKKKDNYMASSSTEISVNISASAPQGL